MPERPNPFAGLQLDRRTELRDSAAWRTAVLNSADTLYVVSSGTRQLLYPGDEARIAFLSNDNPAVRTAEESRLVLLGWSGDAARVLLELDADIAPPLPAGASFEELRSFAHALGEQEAALLAYARALAIWRSRNRYCGICGAPRRSRSAGHVLVCSNAACAHEQFPRLDPAIIVLVSDGERALLGRQASWPPGRYSTLAGFVEPGESLEEAVVREVREETGVNVHTARYRSSQPWPFPSSLMIGFQALAGPDAVEAGGELEDARWFTREDIALKKILLPPPYSISARLIAEWLEAAEV